MTARQELRGKRRELPKKEALPLVVSTEKQLMQLDPTAFANEGNWWPVIFEEMKHGMW
jgi:hypothetical protein